MSFYEKKKTISDVIDKDGIKSNFLKVLVVKEFPRPRTSKNITQFLGLAGYYRRLIPNFSKSLMKLLKKNEKLSGIKHKIKPLELRDLLCLSIAYTSWLLKPNRIISL